MENKNFKLGYCPDCDYLWCKCDELKRIGDAMTRTYPKKGKKNKKFVTLKDIIIPKGTVLVSGATKVECPDPPFEIIIGYGNDHTAFFTIDSDAMEHFPEIFTELKE